MNPVFVLSGIPRSGTTAIRTALDQHSKIKAFYELFNPQFIKGHRFTKKQVDNRIVEWLKLRDTKVSGAHINHGSPPDANLRKYLLERIDAQEDVRVIQIVRRDALAHYLSTVLAGLRGEWHHWKKKPKTAEISKSPVRIEPSHCASFLMRVPERLKEMAWDYRKHVQLWVDYEDFCSDNVGTLIQIQQFLGVPVEHIQPATVKYDRPDVSAMITNYDELMGYLKDHGVSTNVECT